jgi:hypothetical protein
VSVWAGLDGTAAPALVGSGRTGAWLSAGFVGVVGRGLARPALLAARAGLGLVRLDLATAAVAFAVELGLVRAVASAAFGWAGLIGAAGVVGGGLGGLVGAA